MNEWHFKHEFYRTRRDEDIAEGKEGGVAAQVKSQWQYLSANFNWYLPMVIDLVDEDLEEYVIHELGHCFVAEMAKGKHPDLHEERVVTRLARVLRAMHKESTNEPTQEGQKPEGD